MCNIFYLNDTLSYLPHEKINKKRKLEEGEEGIEV
jgi:hypothetical protein